MKRPGKRYSVQETDMDPDGLADRYNELPEGTRKFIQSLRSDEIDTLEDGIRLIQAMRRVGKFVWWVIVIAGGTFITATHVIDNFGKWRGWFK